MKNTIENGSYGLSLLLLGFAIVLLFSTPNKIAYQDLAVCIALAWSVMSFVQKRTREKRKMKIVK